MVWVGGGVGDGGVGADVVVVLVVVVCARFNAAVQNFSGFSDA